MASSSPVEPGTAPAEPGLGYRPLQDILRERLRQSILDIQYPPGARLNTYTIARQFGVSPVPVREALRALEAEGLVEFNPNRGAVVKALTPDELRETFFIRIALVTAATRQAVERMTPDQIEALAAVLEQSRAASDTDDLVRLNRAFHTQLYQAAALPRLVQILEGLSAVASAYQKLSATEADPTELQREHAAILEACRRRDPDGAAALMARHLEASRDRLLAALDHSTPKPPHGTSAN